MATFSFHHLSLQDAIEELVAASIDNEVALTTLLYKMPADWLPRDHQPEAHLLFYLLCRWLEDGSYDAQTNRDRLIDLLGSVQEECQRCGYHPSSHGHSKCNAPGGWFGVACQELGLALRGDRYICHYAVIPQYVEDLGDAVLEYWRRQTEALAVNRQLLEGSPLLPAAWLEESLIEKLGQIAARRKAERHFLPPTPPPAPPPVNLEAIHARRKR